jgi:hypothetical protein
VGGRGISHVKTDAVREVQIGGEGEGDMHIYMLCVRCREEVRG